MFEENEIYAALGLEAPDADVTEETAGEPAEEVAEAPAEEEVDTEPSDEAEETQPEGDEPSDAEPKAELTKEERRRNAQRRREKEMADARREAGELAAKEEREKMDKAIAELYAGKKNPYTGEEIKTLADLQAMQMAEKTNTAAKDLKAGKLTPETIEQILAASPQMKKVNELLEKAEQDAQAASDAKEQTQSERFRQQAESELAEIRKLNPKIQTLNDIISMDTGKDFARYVQQNGLSFIDAYRLANQDAIAAAKAAAAGQRARNAAASKQHLAGMNTGRAGGVEVPEDVKEQYRMFNPGMTDAEINAHYAKYAKGMK